MLILVKLQAEACSFTKSNTPPWVFFTFSKVFQKYQKYHFKNIIDNFCLDIFSLDMKMSRTPEGINISTIANFLYEIFNIDF